MNQNPFASANPFAHVNPFVQTDAPTGEWTYSLVKSGPDVNADEVELAHIPVMEVMILWGTTALHHATLKPGQAFHVGEEHGNYFIPSEVLGTTRAPIVTAAGSLILLPNSTGTIDIPGRGKATFADLIASGQARPSSELSGAHEITLPSGAKARMELGGIAFQITAGNAGKPLPYGLLSDLSSHLYTGLSMLLHVGVLTTLFFFMPGMGADDAEAQDRDQFLRIQHLLNASAEREQEQRDQDPATVSVDKEGGQGARAQGEEGAAGNPNTNKANARFAIQGPRDNPDPHLAKERALKEAADFGMIALLNAGGGADPNAPTAPWGREDSLGNDASSARGNMFGDSIGDAFGPGGLGLSGVGEGGGGRANAIGLDSIGTIGHGAGGGTNQGFGTGHGPVGGGHQVRVPTMRPGTTTVNGRLPAEVIQRIVRQNFGRFRLCYENGLRNNPTLSGRVSIKFAIDRSGAVSMAQDGGSDLPDQNVVQCVVRGFGNLSFPQPEGGVVTVVYPITFNPTAD